ncbi:MAG: serine/threonine-protein kinase, partial [Gammaproteobacteria bacterium]|nr:serine/threonine-protein kinase [Gammaproteobacteria bacterium]
MAELPQKFGKYHVLGLAGRGNMGVVYLGYDPFADRQVAIKVSAAPDPLDGTSSRLARKLFFNEAHMAGVLEHPNILRILDAGEEGGEPYIVMEFVEGGNTLQPFCDPENLLPVPEVADIVARCAKALDYAHCRGVIHRDIKPTNIMRTPEGDVKIGDFGVAQRTMADTTHVMGILGSPRYMSPEQIREETISGQTDLYSLG